MKIKVKNMTSDRSQRPVTNQFIIKTEIGTYFQSYDSIIVFEPYSYKPFKPVSERMPNEKIMLDERFWDYSRTTGKYRNNFLGETKAETEKKIASGEYILTDLN